MSSGTVVPGKPESSSLYQAVYNGSMPSGGTRLTNAELQAIYDWIAAGAPADAAPSPSPQPNPSPAPGSAPSAVTNLAATASTASSVSLSWTLPAGGTLKSVDVERSLNSAGPFTMITTLAGTANSYMDSGLTANTTYYYRVRVANNYGDSPYSNIISAKTAAMAPAPMPSPMPSPAPGAAPAAPTGLTATATSGVQIDLTWTDASSNETGFKVERAAAAAGPFTVIATLGANVQAYSDMGRSAVTTYYYRVSAYNGTGASAATPVASATTFGTFTWVNNNILQAKCARCHSGNNPPRNFSVATYNQTLIKVSPGFADASGLYLRTADGTMPEGGPKLTTTELNAIKTWINSGAANN